MKTPRRFPVSSAHHQNLNTRIDGYAKLSAAALVTAVAVAGTASVSAQAITNITSAAFGGSLPLLTPGQSASFTINGQGFNLAFDSTDNANTHAGHARLALTGATNPAVPGIPIKGDSEGFAKSDTIGPGHIHAFAGVGSVAATSNISGNRYAFGMIQPSGASAVTTGYVGLKLFNGGQSYWGWLRVSVTNGADGYLASIRLKGDAAGVAGAYELGSIKAGEAASAPVPEPGQVATGLGLFALGAAGIREYRRRKQSAAN